MYTSSGYGGPSDAGDVTEATDHADGSSSGSSGSSSCGDPSVMPTGGAANVTCSNRNIDDWGLPRAYVTCGSKEP